jgi:hypothetical protein
MQLRHDRLASKIAPFRDEAGRRVRGVDPSLVSGRGSTIVPTAYASEVAVKAIATKNDSRAQKGCGDPIR